jgi:non-ribosomal peptide synthetase component F
MLPLVHDGKVGSDRTEQGPPFRRLVHELLEGRVREQPYAIAVTCGDVSLTYQALEDRANAVASVLRGTCAVAPDTRVAVVLIAASMC